MNFDSSSCSVVVSILPETPEACLNAVAKLPADSAECPLLVEVRGDRLSAEALDQVLRDVGRPVLLAIRRRQDAGFFTGAERERSALLGSALNHDHVTIDVEWNSELRSLGADSPERRIVSLHGGACDESTLRREFLQMIEEPATAYKRVPEATVLADNLAVRDLLSWARRESSPPLAAFAMGRAGGISRILAGAWGSWGTYGAIDRRAATAPGQGTYRDLTEVYRTHTLGPSTKIFGLVGADLGVSPSPAMHRFGYRSQGLDAVYLPFECASFDEFVALLDAGFEVGGFGVTAPFKTEAAGRCRRLDAISSAARSVNTVTSGTDGWSGFNTDAPAAADAVEELLPLKGARVLVLGAGGTGAAVATEFRDRGARVTVTNRSAARARELAERLGIDRLDWERRAAAAAPAGTEGGWDVLVQTTSLGRAGEQVMPALGGNVHRKSVVLDFAYGPEPTPLIVSAQQIGCRCIDGAELLGRQAVGQFQALTGLVVDRTPLVEISRSRLATLV